MTSTIKRRPRGYRTGISSEVFEFVMKLLRETLGTTGRYLDLMRRNAPLRIQGPAYMRRGWLALGHSSFTDGLPRQFYRWPDGSKMPHAPYLTGYGSWTLQLLKRLTSRQVHNLEYRQHRDSHYNQAEYWASAWLGSLVPFRNTYNASRII